NRLNAIDLEQRLDDSSFDIEGLGVTAEESQNAIGKWFPWWPYYPTGIWCRANENITLTVTGGALQL
ncbi:MAG: hypothetical protein FWF58_04770, partial [Firmicutes bacterium]|nr:hypothetical protein [Bacillota bacterium]